jgi:hypothetical protein
MSTIETNEWATGLALYDAIKDSELLQELASPAPSPAGEVTVRLRPGVIDIVGSPSAAAQTVAEFARLGFRMDA